MKSLFRGYYKPTKEELAELWKECTFSFDANVLLHAYGYSNRTRDTLLGILESIQDQLWIPHQFAAEYHRHRAAVILKQAKRYQNMTTSLKVIADELGSKKQHPFVGDSYRKGLARLLAELNRQEKRYKTCLSDDPILTKITEFFDGKVGRPPTPDELSAMHAEGQIRFEKKVPPGYKDEKKPEPDRYGDYVGWRQILNYGSEKKRPLILITDEEKEDWWHREDNRTIGPRPELVSEYIEASGQVMYLYSLDHFMRLAQQNLGQRVLAAALTEVRERRIATSEAQDVKSEPLPEAPKIVSISSDGGDVKQESNVAPRAVKPDDL